MVKNGEETIGVVRHTSIVRISVEGIHSFHFINSSVVYKLVMYLSPDYYSFFMHAETQQQTTNKNQQGYHMST